MSRLHFELVTPEKTFFSGDVDQVVVPGSEGEMTVLNAHQPLMTLVKSGVIQYVDAGKAKAIYVRDGFADISPIGLTILAQFALNVEDIKVANLNKDIANAQDDLKDAKTDADKAKATAKLESLNDMLQYAKN